MKNRHLILVDLDGTILNSKKRLTQRTKTVIEKVMKLGHIVCIATGRPYLSSKKYYEELQLETPIINFNGGYIHNPNDNSFKAIHNTLEQKNVLELINHIEDTKAKQIMVEIMDDVYLRYEGVIHGETYIDENNKIIYGCLKTNIKNSPTSILVFNEESHINILKTKIRADKRFNKIGFKTWNPEILEIANRENDKVTGIKAIASHYKIPKSRIISFGDEENDKGMIEYSQLGYVVKNGSFKLQQIADEVIESNDNNGVAKKLEELFIRNSRFIEI